MKKVVNMNNSEPAKNVSTTLTDTQDCPADSIHTDGQALSTQTTQISDKQKTQSSAQWSEPVPFSIVSIPRYPVNDLPQPVAAIVRCMSESTQTPPEMAGTLVLGVLSTAFQKGYSVRITPDWREQLSMWVVAIAEPGERKSNVINMLIKPVQEYETEVNKAEAREIAQNQAERKLLEKRLENATKMQKKSSLAEQEHEVQDLSAQLADFVDKHALRLLVDDTTPEKLADIMEQQDGCITVCSSEGGVFDNMRGRYDRNKNFDVYLKGHSGDSLTVDRIHRESNHIQHPRITMMLTVQPFVLAGLMNDAGMKGKGLCGRFMYAMCPSNVGYRKVRAEPIPDDVKEKYEDFVRRILSDDRKGEIVISDEAMEVFYEFMEKIEKLLGSEWMDMRDWGGKLAGATARIAALLHLANDNGADIPISVETMKNAIAIAEVLSEHAKVAYQVMGANKGTEDAKNILARLSNYTGDTITRTDLTRLCRGRFAKAEQMDQGLEILEDMGYIRSVKTEIDYNNRRKTIYEINPWIRGN